MSEATETARVVRRKATPWVAPKPKRRPSHDVRKSLRGEVEAEFRAVGAKVWR
jgi:hypothetical protein